MRFPRAFLHEKKRLKERLQPFVNIKRIVRYLSDDGNKKAIGSSIAFCIIL